MNKLSSIVNSIRKAFKSKSPIADLRFNLFTFNIIKLAKKGKEKIIQSQKQRFRTGLERLQEQYGLTPDDYDEYTPAVMRQREGEMLWLTTPGLR